MIPNRAPSMCHANSDRWHCNWSLFNNAGASRYQLDLSRLFARLFASENLHGDEMYATFQQAKGLYGYWSGQEWCVPPTFDEAYPFYSHFAVIRTKNGYGLLGTDGTLFSLKELLGKEPTEFFGFVGVDERSATHSLAHINNSGVHEWALLSGDMNVTWLPSKYFCNARSAGLWGTYVIFEVENNGYSEGGLFDLSTMSIHIAPSRNIHYFYPSRDGLWIVANGNSQKAFLDVTSGELASPWLADALPFSEGFGAILSSKDGWHFVDESLSSVFNRTFESVGRFTNGLAPVLFEDESGYVNSDGGTHVILNYVELSAFTDYGWAIANRDALDWNIDIIGRDGLPRIGGFDTAVVWNGDFPCLDVSKGEEDLLFDVTLKRIFLEDVNASCR